VSEISPDLARALNAGHAPFLLFYCDHPSGPARFWSRTGILEFDGHQWTGCGRLGKITGGKRSTDLTINEVTFELKGVPPTTDALLSDKVQNRIAQVWRGAISSSGRVTVDDDPTIEAVLDYQKLSTDPRNTTATLSIKGYQGFYVLDRAQDIAFTDQQQRLDYPDDCGAALVHLWVNRQSNWRFV
jgi:hypothetical protein